MEEDKLLQIVTFLHFGRDESLALNSVQLWRGINQIMTFN